MMRLNYHVIMLIKTSILKIINVDIVQPINNAVAVNAYNKSEIDIGLNLKSYKIDT